MKQCKQIPSKKCRTKRFQKYFSINKKFQKYQLKTVQTPKMRSKIKLVKKKIIINKKKIREENARI